MVGSETNAYASASVRSVTGGEDETERERGRDGEIERGKETRQRSREKRNTHAA